ncbi:MAG: hypothetical protein G01um10148_103 [Parcubacteria group bacterium Gr01-1014_8]|nr:MAG: hypothetical protein G01um10148_103 [Parcubacteria group bacterium Gr01-1014_8]
MDENPLDQVPSDEVAELSVMDPQEEPDFPFVIVATAVLKDLLDGLDLSIIFIILTTVLSVLLTIILFLWVVGKLGGGWWKRQLIRWLWTRYVATILLEFIPFLKMVPAATIFVLMAHHHEKKSVKLFNAALEAFRDGLFKALRQKN